MLPADFSLRAAAPGAFALLCWVLAAVAVWDGLGKGPYACLPVIAVADAAAVALLYVLPAVVGWVGDGKGKAKEKRE